MQKVNLAAFWQVQASKLFKTNFCSFFGILAQGWQVCFSQLEGEGTEEMSEEPGKAALLCPGRFKLRPHYMDSSTLLELFPSSLCIAASLPCTWNREKRIIRKSGNLRCNCSHSTVMQLLRQLEMKRPGVLISSDSSAIKEPFSTCHSPPPISTSKLVVLQPWIWIWG